jgi:ribosomal protein L40E
VGRGQKLCKRCQTPTGPRAYVCKKCGFEFSFKAAKEKKSRELVTDFTELTKGETVLIKGGPYYATAEGNLRMSEKGKAKFISVLNDGILVYGSEGFAYLYTGKEFVSEATKVVMRPYRIYRKKKTV